jgi:hypothetical protein
MCWKSVLMKDSSEERKSGLLIHFYLRDLCEWLAPD